MGFAENKIVLAIAVAALGMLGSNGCAEGNDAAETRVEKGSLTAPVKAGSLGSGRPSAGSMSAGKPAAGSLTIGKPQAGSLSSGKPAAGSMSSGVVGGSLAPVVGPPQRAPSKRRASMKAADDGSSRTRTPREPRRRRY